MRATSGGNSMPRELTAHEAADLLTGFNFGEVAARTLDRVRPGLVARMRAEAPYSTRQRTGKKQDKHLRDTIIAVRHTGVGGGQMAVTSDSPHARFVLDGTRAHEIHPKGVSVDQPVGSGGHPLAFFWEKVGANVKSFGWHGSPYGFVRIPAHKPNRFNERAWAGSRLGVVATFRDTALEQLMKGRL